MPITMDAYRFPAFQKYKQQEPFTESKSAKFEAADMQTPIRRYRSESFPQAGYNPNSNSATVKKVNINTDNYTLPSY